jgi:hypothetical protein
MAVSIRSKKDKGLRIAYSIIGVPVTFYAKKSEIQKLADKQLVYAGNRIIR